MPLPQVLSPVYLSSWSFHKVSSCTTSFQWIHLIRNRFIMPLAPHGWRFRALNYFCSRLADRHKSFPTKTGVTGPMLHTVNLAAPELSLITSETFPGLLKVKQDIPPDEGPDLSRAGRGTELFCGFLNACLGFLMRLIFFQKEVNCCYSSLWYLYLGERRGSCGYSFFFKKAGSLQTTQSRERIHVQKGRNQLLSKTLGVIS